MPRLACVLIAGVFAVALGAPLAQSQTPPQTTEQAPPPAAQPAPEATPEAVPVPKDRKSMTSEEKAKAKADRRAAKKKARTEKRAAKKAKRQECRTQGKQNNLRGKKLREFVKTCTAG